MCQDNNKSFYLYRALHFEYFQEKVLILKGVTATIYSQLLKMGINNHRKLVVSLCSSEFYLISNL